jgi:hypothetical protein
MTLLQMQARRLLAWQRANAKACRLLLPHDSLRRGVSHRMIFQ